MDLSQKTGRPLALSVTGHGCIGKNQTMRGLCHHKIQIELLNAAVLFGRRSQFQIHGLENSPIPVCEQAAFTLSLRHHSLVNANKKQHLDCLQPAPCNISYHDLVDSSRDHSHLNFLKACVQNLSIVLHIRLFITQKPLQTFKKFHHPIIHLTVLLCQIFVPRLFTLEKIFLIIFHLFLKRQLLQVRSERLCHGSHRCSLGLKCHSQCS